ncbi:immune inhibitor A domain-containing protein [Thalassotalea ganghwensis]
MKVTWLGCLSLLFCSIANAIDLPEQHFKASADIGVINKEQILYWLVKRGELAQHATDVEKQRALEQYLGKKQFGHQADVAKVKAKRRANKNLVNKSVSFDAKSKAVDTTVKVLAVMVDFSDLKHDENADIGNQDTSQQHYNNLVFSHDWPEGISAYEYYQQESGGTFFLTGQAYGWVTADNNAAYYGENDPDSNDDDIRPGELVIEAINKAVTEFNIDLAEYDLKDPYDLDQDGNLNEPDGIIDHVMVFHASIGEEAGGGSLGEDAIWAHRSAVANQAVQINDTDYKVWGYTINPINSRTGVVVHEFGHDLGLPDEYDTASGQYGSPVANWSVMASGSWLGTPGGSSPATFSSYARDFLQQTYLGNWINQYEVDLQALNSETINLVAANNHQDGINQVKILLPNKQVSVGAPKTGAYQYYSGRENLKDNRLSFALTLPAQQATLTMTARWNIELDWDYVQILVNGDAIAGNHTKTNNTERPEVTNFISGNSADIEQAYGELHWVDLSFSLADYLGQEVTIDVRYKTDEYVLEQGFFVDDIALTANGTVLFTSGGEAENEVTLAGFSRVSDTADGKPHHYYAQLRNYSGTDAKLEDDFYEPGVLLWYRDENVDDNQVNIHPGEVFIGVVDADQQLITSQDTFFQVRDATFSLYDQSPFSGDNHLTANPLFSDQDDYSSPQQPASGIILPKLGVMMEVVSQASDSATASIVLSKQSVSDVKVTQTGLQVVVALEAPSLIDGTEITWNMGDGTELIGETVSHTYSEAGLYTIIVNYVTEEGSQTISQSVTVGQPITGDFSSEADGLSVSFGANLIGGFGEFSYQWNFGDGNSSTEAAPTHTFSATGSYNVQLIVTDATEQRFTFTNSVEVVEPLSASISRTVNNLAISVQSTPSGGDGNYNYLWDFGDGTTAQTANANHTYSQAGTYTITLEVSDGAGESVQTSISVTVSSAKTTQTSKSSSGGGLGIFALTSLVLIGIMRRQLSAVKSV